METFYRLIGHEGLKLKLIVFFAFLRSHRDVL